MDLKLSQSPDCCKVRVAVRVRPLLPKETTPSCITLSKNQPNELIIGGNRSFIFDKAFDSNIPQNNIFDGCVKELLEGFFTGYNATILAYGQTGSGKTYTMGSLNSFNLNEEDIGIIPRVIRSIFQEIDKKKAKTEFLLKVSFLEIYNEEIIDLLDRTGVLPTNRLMANKKPTASVTIREEKDGSIGLYGLIEEKVSSYDEMLACLERGSLSRTTSSTLMNESSSRSHAIFSVILEQHFIDDLFKVLPPNSSNTSNKLDDDKDSPPEFITAKFHFVDLAGSERIKKTGATGSTLREGININKGLLCLGNVIAALTETNTRGHIPYRDSKLTRILQDSLGGNARTYMIACVSPAESNYEETLNTLKYASRARNIKNKPKINTDPNTALVNQMKQQIFELKEELMKYRMALKKHLNEQDFQGLLKENYDKEKLLINPSEENNGELKDLKLKVLRYEKDLLRLDSEKHILRKELDGKEIEFLTIKRERDLIRIRLERTYELLEKHGIANNMNESEETKTISLLEEYNNVISKMTRDLQDKNVLLKEIQIEYEKLLGSTTGDQELLLQKTQEIETLQKLFENKEFKSKNSFELNNVSLIEASIRNEKDVIGNVKIKENNDDSINSNVNANKPDENIEEESKTREFLSVNKTTEKQIYLVDETIRMKEELLKKMSEGQSYLEQSLLEEMRQQYHQKIESLQAEIRGLEKERDQAVNKQPLNDNGVNSAFLMEKTKFLNINKQKMMELEAQIKDYKKKEKIQAGLLKQVSSQKNQLESLAEEIKSIKKQKLQLMKKLKEDTENFEKWKTSHQRKLNDLTRKNQEKDLQILRLKSESQRKVKETKENLSEDKQHRGLLRRRTSFLEESSNLKLILTNGLDLLKEYVHYNREINREEKRLDSIHCDIEELSKRNATITIEYERLQIEKKKKTLDFEEEINYENKENELLTQRREIRTSIDSLEANARFLKRCIEDKRKGKNDKKNINIAKYSSIDDIYEEIFNKTKIAQDGLRTVLKGLYEEFIGIFENKLELCEKNDMNNLEVLELKRSFEALEQKFKVSQAQYELNITSITAEYEEKCLFLIKQQNEQMMDTTISNVNNGVSSSGGSEMGGETIKQRNGSVGLDERKKMGSTSTNIGSLRKNYDEAVNKILRLEKSLGDLAKKQQNSDKLIQTLKRKLEIVSEKYDQMKKQFSKEKYIGLPQTHRPGENNSFGDLSSLLDSPTKTPRKDLKAVNHSLTSLKDRREFLKKTATTAISTEINEYLLEGSKPELIDELEGLQERFRNDSFVGSVKGGLISNDTGHKKNVSLYISKPANITGQIHSSRSNFGKDLKCATYKNDLNSSDENKDNSSNLINNNPSSLILLDSDLAQIEGSVNQPLDTTNEYVSIKWKITASWEAHPAAVYAICSYGNLLYSSSNKCFKVWSLDNMKSISEVNAHPSFIKTMILWPEKNVLLTACEKVISVWDVITMKHVTSLKAHKDEIRCLYAYNDLLFSGGKGTISSGALFAWDLRSANFIEEKEKSQDIFSLLAHGSVLYYGSRSHQVCRLNLENNLEHMTPFESPHFDAVSSLTVIKDHLISGSRDKNLKLWSLDRSFNNNLHTAYAHQDWINVLEKNRAETVFYSGSRDGIVKIWGIYDNKLSLLSDLNSHSQSVNSICNLDESYENTIATASSDKSIKLWKVSSSIEPSMAFDG